ncbi:MAG: T9SS type A sorting domain-containing protein [Cryomorphaceae bacterium]
MKKLLFITLLSIMTGECFSQDQTLDWFTYFGGPSQEERFNDLTFGLSGDLFIAGRVESDELLFDAAIHQDFYAGDVDVFLARFSVDGQLIWTTYFGGAETDLFDSMCALPDGRIVIAGATTSDEGIVFDDAFQEERVGSADFFLAAFNPDGTLDWSTYWGGMNAEQGLVITCDTEGSILIAGRTDSQDLATPGAFDESFDPFIGTNPIVAKFSNTGELLWCTYLNADIFGFEESIATDGMGNIYYAINTPTDEGLATEGAYQTAGVGNSALLVKFSPEGERLWSTYVTGEGDESNSLVEADSEGNVYLSARTSSETGIATEGAFQMENIPPQVFPVGSSAMIMKFNPDGERIWGTYFGGLYSKDITSIKSVDSGILFSYRNQFNEDQIFGNSPFQSDIMGSSDVFVTKFTEGGDIVWSTAFGGNSFDYDDAFAVRGDMFALSGGTSSSEFYQNEDSWQPELNGTSDLYLALFTDNVLSANTIEKDSPQLSVYPNPSSAGNIRLDWELENVDLVDLVIFDQLGRVIESITGYPKNSDLALSLPSGMYFLTFQAEESMYSKKLIID